MQFTKTRVRSDWRYARELMRQAEAALRDDDIETLRDIALDLSSAASVLNGYLHERGIEP